MYSTLAISDKSNGKIVGTHQKLDRIARKIIDKNLPHNYFFPNISEILNFEGMGGPDGLKRKSPGVDEPMHFIDPDHDNGKLMTLILDHQYNLRKALEEGNKVRASFEAGWMAHAITDGLTPAHHFPLESTQKQLMTKDEFVKVFGIPIKGIMRGRNSLETLRNNWLYWGANGFMTKHVAFEYGVAITLTALPECAVMPKIKKAELIDIDLEKAFHESLAKVHALKMYENFLNQGWNTELVFQTKNVLLPEIVRAITLGWASSIPYFNKKLLK